MKCPPLVKGDERVRILYKQYHPPLEKGDGGGFYRKISPHPSFPRRGILERLLWKRQAGVLLFFSPGDRVKDEATIRRFSLNSRPSWGPGTAIFFYIRKRSNTFEHTCSSPFPSSWKQPIPAERRRRGMGEKPVRRRSGHGSSTVRRGERSRSRSKSARWADERVSKPSPGAFFSDRGCFYKLGSCWPMSES